MTLKSLAVPLFRGAAGFGGVTTAGRWAGVATVFGVGVVVAGAVVGVVVARLGVGTADTKGTAVVAVVAATSIEGGASRLTVPASAGGGWTTIRRGVALLPLALVATTATATNVAIKRAAIARPRRRTMFPISSGSGSRLSRLTEI